MDQFEDVIGSISRPFEQEIRKGCTDEVVIGGMKNYVEHWVTKSRQLGIGLAEKQNTSLTHPSTRKFLKRV